jgi:hypothetical protein
MRSTRLSDAPILLALAALLRQTTAQSSHSR